MAATESARNLPTILKLAALIVVAVGLYVARELCIPVALAILLTFLLAPIVSRLQKWRVPRAPAVLLVVAFLLLIIGSGGWIITGQLIQLADKLPQYKEIVHEKLAALHAQPGSTLDRLNRTFQDYANEVQAITSAATETRPEPGSAAGSQPRIAETAPRKIEVTLAKSSTTGLEVLRNLAIGAVEPLTMLGVVLILTLFMLIQREDLRDRALRLVGNGQLNVSTQAMDDAAGRVSRYLLMQLMVNSIFGVCTYLGLLLIGVPYSPLWGLLAACLRFMPYFGVPAAAIPPMVMAFVASPGFTGIILTLVLFTLLELAICYGLEPWLYGSRTGLSPLAILGSALFWGWLWGPMGLLLSTPLTVCLAVIGRHVPRLRFLNIMFGDEPALAPEVRFYQRLLANDQDEASEIAEQQLRQSSLVELFDSLIIPAMILIEQDRYRGELDEGRVHRMIESIRNIIDDMDERTPTPTRRDPEIGGARRITILCVPANDAADELGAHMLASLIRRRGGRAVMASSEVLAGERFSKVEELSPDLVCVSAVPPQATLHARYLCKHLRAGHPDLAVMVGLWRSAEDPGKIQERLPKGMADYVETSMSAALARIDSLPGVPAAATQDFATHQ